MSEWVICRGCAMKYRAGEGVCPRCDRPTDADQIRWTADRLSAPVSPVPRIALAVAVGLLLVGLGTFIFLSPAGARAAGWASVTIAAIGALVLCGSWVWAVRLAYREGIGWVGFVVLVPYVSVAVMGKWKVLGLKLLGTAVVVLGVWLVPAGFFGLEQKVTRACEGQGIDEEECACIGRKTVGLMSAADRQALFDPQSPQVRELMLTSGLLCTKERLINRCVSGNQGSMPMCVCLTDAAVNTFTPAVLSDLFERAAASTPPSGYSAIRADCLKKLPTAR